MNESPDTPAPAAEPAPDPAEVIAAAVLATQGVEALHPGAFGEVATYLPGRRVVGVRLRDPGCEVHVTLAWGAPVLATSDSVRAAVAALGTGGPIDVVVEDVADPTPGPK